MPEPAAAGAIYAHNAPAQIARITLVPANAANAWRYLQWNKLIQAYYHILMVNKVFVKTNSKESIFTLPISHKHDLYDI